MDRIGDRFSWDGVDASGADRLYHYRYLAADHDFIDSDGGSTHGSHPDADGVMFNMALQNEDFSSVSAAAYAATAGRKLTLSRWQSIQTSQRGSIDMNFALDDGSVERYTDVRWNEGLEHDRFTRAAEFSDGWLYPQFTIQLPTQ
jgi:hypothetical protein